MLQDSRASKPVSTPVAIVTIAAYVHTTIARPSFMPRFCAKMPLAEKPTDATMPSGARPRAGAPYSATSS